VSNQTVTVTKEDEVDEVDEVDEAISITDVE
jgi:hypothetical protein